MRGGRQASALSPVDFNEILRSRTCVYCKALLPVGVKCTDEQGVALLTMSKKPKERKKEEEEENLTLLLPHAPAWESD